MCARENACGLILTIPFIQYISTCSIQQAQTQHSVVSYLLTCNVTPSIAPNASDPLYSVQHACNVNNVHCLIYTRFWPASPWGQRSPYTAGSSGCQEKQYREGEHTLNRIKKILLCLGTANHLYLFISEQAWETHICDLFTRKKKKYINTIQF